MPFPRTTTVTKRTNPSTCACRTVLFPSSASGVRQFFPSDRAIHYRSTNSAFSWWRRRPLWLRSIQSVLRQRRWITLPAFSFNFEDSPSATSSCNFILQLADNLTGNQILSFSRVEMGERAGMHQRLTTAGGGVADLPDHVHPRTVVLFRQEHLGQNHVIADPRHVHEPDVGRQELTAAFDVVGDVYFRGLEEMCILEGVGVSTSKY